MRTEFVYSLAALAAFPIAVNANVTAESIGKITAKKDQTAWEKVSKELAVGNYRFYSDALSTGTAGKKATVTLYEKNGELIQIIEGKQIDVTVGQKFSIDFTLTAPRQILVKVQLKEACDADFVVDDSEIELLYDFTKVGELLLIEYNKVTQVLEGAKYANKAQDAQDASKLYDRVVAIASADYAFYAKDSEGLQAIYAGDQTDVTGLDLYTEIGTMLETVKNKELAYLDGPDQLVALNNRYDKLDGYAISYVTTGLTGKKGAAIAARDAFAANPNAETLKATYDALKAYDDELKAVEAIAADNEEAKKNLDAAWSGVYDKYYNDAVTLITEQYPDARYTDLRVQALAALAAIVDPAGSDFKPVNDAINKAYTDKKAKAEQTNLGIMISEFKEKLTRTVNEHNEAKDKLTAAYEQYDEQKKSADALTADAAGFLVDNGYKQAVDDAVAALLTFIEANDQKETVENLTDGNLLAKKEVISSAKAEYTKQAAIYADYKALKGAVAAETTSLNGVKTAIDKDAKDTKKLDEAVFKPTTIWATTIAAIEGQIATLDGKVNANESDATNYKDSKEYKEGLDAIKNAIAAFNGNALDATARYATIASEIKTANDLRAALLDPAKDPKVDLTELNVWTNQVTIDDAIKARTPYKAFINDGDGSVTEAIAQLETDLAAAPGKTEVLNEKGDNVGNILAYLKSLANKEAAVVNGTSTMEAIKANYTTDEEKFAVQIDLQEAAGIAVMINGKAEVFEPMIAALQKRINDKEFGAKKGAKLQEEINKITDKINAAKAAAAKVGATTAELTVEYDKIKDLDTKDIKDAQDHATAYAAEYGVFTDRYNTLNGTDKDGAGASTVFGLKKYYDTEKENIKAMKNLTDAQKSSLYDKIDNVVFERVVGDKKETFTLASIQKFIEEAAQNEELKAETVADYQTNIIPGLKVVASLVTVHAINLNTLEGDIADAKKGISDTKAEVLKKDKNENGFYYLLLTGQYTTDINKLQGDIEADVDLSATDVTTFQGKIADVNDKVALTPGQADDNLKAYNAAKDAYDKDDKNNPGALQRYAIVKALLDEATSSQLPTQQAVIAQMKDALDELIVKAEASYNAGKAKADDYQSKINTQIKDIEDQVAEYINPVNYNAQIAADNKAMDAAITAAKNAADASYAVSSSIINTYKLFKSEELTAARDQAPEELQALLDYLVGYEKMVTDLRAQAADDYAKIVSPEKFDEKGSYVAQFEKIKADLEGLTQDLSNKINEYAVEEVAASVLTYSTAIKESKALVKTFSAGDPLADNVVDGLFNNIEKLLKDITDVEDVDAEIKALDNALVAAAASGTGILAQIEAVEQNQARAALQTIVNTIDANLLSTADQTSFYDIKAVVESAAVADKAKCVSNFETYKSSLKSLKAKADQQAQDNATIAATQNAIIDAYGAVAALEGNYMDFAAGYTVKADVEKLRSDIEQYDPFKVNLGNAEEWKKAADAIKAGVTPVYEKLYEAEVVAIEGNSDVKGLIATAKEENLTYGGDKAAISALITARENDLANVKKAVADNDKDPKTGTNRTDALNFLRNIEEALNTYINTMTKANAGDNVDMNAILYAQYYAEANTQTKIFDATKTVLDGYTKPTAYWDYFWSIDGAIMDLKGYLVAHEDEMVAYEENAKAMLADIDDALAEFSDYVVAEKEAQDKAAKEAAELLLANTWKTSENKIQTAKNQVKEMNIELEAYGSANNYTNKVNKLNDQIDKAQKIYDDSYKKAANMLTADAQVVAGETIDAVDEALANLANNCNDIKGLAQQAYIDEFIAKLDAQIIADTWTASANYTDTDKGTLTNARNNLIGLVAFLKANAEGKFQANDIKDLNGDVIYKGVITTLNEGEKQFDEDLATLKANVKDMSLVEDKKGHIANNGQNEEITSDDLEALADIILNDEEFDLEACDVDGNGEVDVTDLVWLRYFLVHNDWPAVPAAAREMASNANDAVGIQVLSTNGNITRLAINLTNDTEFRDFQVKMQLPAGAKVVGNSLGERVEGVNLISSQSAEGTVSFVALATSKGVINGEEGAVLYLDVENLNGVVTIGKAVFVDSALRGHDLTSTTEATGIRETIANAIDSATQKFYDVSGRMLNTLKNGINIIRNADGTSKKVLK